MLRIVCWKWKPEQGSKHPVKRAGFSSEHVNRLHGMLSRFLARPFRLYCVTDDWKGIDSAVQVININRHFSQHAELGGCYRRLRAFDLSTAVALFGGPFISIDLDVVVTGPLDELFRWQEFRIWQDTYRRFCPYCGSLWAMRPGARQKVWDVWHQDPGGWIDAVKRSRYVGTDQAFVSYLLYPNGAEVWTKEDGIYNFNTQVRQCFKSTVKRRGVLTDIPGRTGELPEGAKLVFFNGKFDPSQKELQRQYDWIGDLWR